MYQKMNNATLKVLKTKKYLYDLHFIDLRIRDFETPWTIHFISYHISSVMCLLKTVNSLHLWKNSTANLFCTYLELLSKYLHPPPPEYSATDIIIICYKIVSVSLQTVSDVGVGSLHKILIF